MKNTTRYHSPIGPLTVTVDGNTVTGIQFGATEEQADSLTPFLSHTILQLTRYFDGKSAEPLDVAPEGTAFQKRVWRALQAIPSGKTCSYGDIASLLETSPRAVGNACRANPIVILIPCHRITAKHRLGGFAGKTQGEMIDRKKWLLAHEST